MLSPCYLKMGLGDKRAKSKEQRAKGKRGFGVCCSFLIPHSSLLIFFAAFVVVFGAGFSAAFLAAVLGTGFLCEIGGFFAAAALAACFEAPDFVES
jgi:hypothetical protein